MLYDLILENYGLKLNSFKLIYKHFGTEIFIAEADNKKYIVKTLPLYVNGVEEEGGIAEFLFENGVNVPVYAKNKNNGYYIKTDNMQFHIQKFIEGETLKLNTAPNWILYRSAEILGEIQRVLRNYKELPVYCDETFFGENNVNKTITFFKEKMNKTSNIDDGMLIRERIDHLERISQFNIETSRLTYANTHGDFDVR